MDTMIAYCGLDCTECPAFIARLDDNDELRMKTALEWSEQFGIDVSPGSIDCSGCCSEGVHSPYCQSCEIRACGMARGLANCAYCDDYACEKLSKVHAMDTQCRQRLDDIRSRLSSIRPAAAIRTC